MGELYHHGILGMKWGIRRYQPYGSGGYTPSHKGRFVGKKKTKPKNHPDYDRVHDGKKVNQMSDSELKERNTRLQAEQQYNMMTRKSSKGQEAVKKFIKTAGTATAVLGAYKAYEKLGKEAIDQIGNFVMSDLAKHINK